MKNPPAMHSLYHQRSAERRSALSHAMPQQGPAFPKEIQHGIDQEFQDEARQETSDHRGRNALHHFAASSARPHDGYQTEKRGHHSHHFRADSLHGSLDDRFMEVLETVHAASLHMILIRKVKICHFIGSVPDINLVSCKDLSRIHGMDRPCRQGPTACWVSHKPRKYC